MDISPKCTHDKHVWSNDGHDYTAMSRALVNVMRCSNCGISREIFMSEQKSTIVYRNGDTTINAIRC